MQIWASVAYFKLSVVHSNNSLSLFWVHMLFFPLLLHLLSSKEKPMLSFDLNISRNGCYLISPFQELPPVLNHPTKRSFLCSLFLCLKNMEKMISLFYSILWSAQWVRLISLLSLAFFCILHLWARIIFN